MYYGFRHDGLAELMQINEKKLLDSKIRLFRRKRSEKVKVLCKIVHFL